MYYSEHPSLILLVSDSTSIAPNHYRHTLTHKHPYKPKQLFASCYSTKDLIVWIHSLKSELERSSRGTRFPQMDCLISRWVERWKQWFRAERRKATYTPITKSIVHLPLTVMGDGLKEKRDWSQSSFTHLSTTSISQMWILNTLQSHQVCIFNLKFENALSLSLSLSPFLFFHSHHLCLFFALVWTLVRLSAEFYANW